MFRVIFLILLYFSISLLSTNTASADKRVALIIGNNNYQHVSRLKNPANDANKLAKLLKQSSFTTVIHNSNLTYRKMRSALRHFSRLSRGSDIALIYFSGHGLEIGGTNYLVPIDAKLISDDDIYYEAINLNEVLRSVNGAKKLRLVILDACRNNPFASKMTRNAGLTKSVTKGFAPVNVEGNILVAYAAKDGTVAFDGNGDNSPFAQALLTYLAKPGLDIRRAFGYIRDTVRKSTHGKQEPWLYGSLGGDVISLVPGKQTTHATKPGCDPSDTALWNWANSKKNKAAYTHYQKKFPKGCYSSAAEFEIAALQKLPKQPTKPIIENTVGVYPDKFVHGYKFQDCDICPKMIVVKGGSFVMGSSQWEKKREEKEGPQRQVTIKKFTVGQFEITQGQYHSFVQQSGYNAGNCNYTKNNSYLSPGFSQTPNHPATCVSWNDAKAYVRWLSHKTGKSYRLLSEAEWEYAAGANRSFPFWWGTSITTEQANYDGQFTYNGPKGIFRKKTVPVNSFKANPFGLYNVHGNLDEWVEDCQHKNYNGAPTDGSPWLQEGGGNCIYRVLRGGSWYSRPQYARTRYRTRTLKGYRFNMFGFRVARDLTVE